MPCQGCDCGPSAPSGRTCKKASSSKPSSGATVALPHRSDAAKANESTPLWATSSASYGGTASEDPSSADGAASTISQRGLSAPASSSSLRKCEKNNIVRGGVCCRELKASDERRLVDPDTVRDVIIGLSDGLTVPFALTAGLSGVGSSRIVVIAGFAELVSGAISMGVGGFLSAQAELQHYNWTKQQTRERVARSCSSAVADEVSDILSPYGVPIEVAHLVASKLQGVEQAVQASNGGLLPQPSTSAISSSGSSALSGTEDDEETEKGLTPFILRLGEGLEPISSSRAWQSAITIGISYFLGGLLPLFPYIFMESVQDALVTSVVVTGIVLLIFGVVKQRCTGGTQGWGYLYGAVSTLAVGGLAAGASWLIVRTLEGGDAAW